MDGWTAIVLAAGRGSRMRSNVPKPLQPIAGSPLLVHALRTLREAGADACVVVASPADADALRTVAEDATLVEQAEPLGTGDALRVGLKALPPTARLAVAINADVPLVRPGSVQALLHAHNADGAVFGLLTAQVPRMQAAGLGRVRRDAEGAPEAVVEAQDDAGGAADAEVNVGCYSLDVGWARTALAALPSHPSGEFHLPALAAAARKDGHFVAAVRVGEASEALSVNTRADQTSAEAAMQARLRSRAIEAGASLVDPASTYLDADTVLEADAVIQPNTAVRGRSRVSAGALVGPNAVLHDAIVGPGARIAGAVVEGAEVGEGAHVGPFSYLREGTVLEPGAYVGSHAEVKASRIGRGAHVGHFSYVGDAEVGAGANIGAGTVTCNYDGREKHRTIIGEGAFIGSDSLLVAPVRVGAGALTGAGAVVTENVPDGARVAGVPARPLARRNRPMAGGEGERTLG